MQADSFYVTAPSNASTKKYPNNHGGKYKFDLPESLHLSPEWEVALSEITYRQDWNNIQREDLWLRLDTKAFNKDSQLRFENERKFLVHWKTLLSHLKEFAYQIALQSDHNKVGEMRYIKWLDENKPMTMDEFISKFNEEIALAYGLAGWGASAPYLKYMPIKSGGSFLPRMTLQHYGYNFTELSGKMVRLWRLVNSAGISKAPKRCFTFQDFRITYDLYLLLKAFGVYSFPEITLDKNILTYRSAEDAALKSSIYKNKQLDAYFFPAYIFGSKGKATIEKYINKHTDIVQNWPEVPRTYFYSPNALPPPYQTGKEVYFDKEAVIHSEQDVARQVKKMVKQSIVGSGAVLKKTGKGVWVETKGSRTTNLKTRISFSIGNVLIWRLKLSHALYNLLGFGLNQLKENVFIVPQYYTVDGSHYKNVENLKLPLPFGFNESNISASLTDFTSRYKADLTRNISSLWVYSDVCTPTIVGDSKSSLLRTIPVKTAERGQINLHTFEAPYYFPLQRHTLTDLEMSIYDTHGRAPIRFSSHVVCQLHFRRQKRRTKDEEPELKRMRMSGGESI